MPQSVAAGFRRIATIWALNVGLLGAFAMPSSAGSIEDKQAQARRIATEREVLVEKAERLSQERVRQAGELEVVNAQLSWAGTVLGRQEAAASDLQVRIRTMVVNSYVYGSASTGLNALLSQGASSDSSARFGYSSSVLGDRNDLLDQYQATSQDRRKQRDELAVVQRRQTELATSLEAAASSLVKTQSQLAALELTVGVELQALVAAEQVRLAREAELRAQAETERRARQLRGEQERQVAAQRQAAQLAVHDAARQETARRVATSTTTITRRAIAGPAVTARPSPATTAGRGSATTQATTVRQPTAPRPTVAPPPDYPAPSPAAAVAVQAAKSQLGVAYVFGANGPTNFDCSGLTQWAWAKAGVSMSHYTVSQYNEFPRVPLDALQPGDLVFFNVDLGHMGMYIGGRLVHPCPENR